jgi:phage shock protein A
MKPFDPEETAVQYIDRLETRIEELESALREIARGEGRYSHDQYEHACNTIEDLKAIARAALDKDAGAGE